VEDAGRSPRTGCSTGVMRAGGLRTAGSRGSSGSSQHRSARRSACAASSGMRPGGAQARFPSGRRATRGGRRHVYVPSGSVTLQEPLRCVFFARRPPGRRTRSVRAGSPVGREARGERKTPRARTDAATLHGARRRRPRLSGERPEVASCDLRAELVDAAAFCQSAREATRRQRYARRHRSRGRTRLAPIAGSPKRAHRREPRAPASWGIDAECTVTSGRSS